MNNLNRRVSLISKITEMNPGLGKTAMMKLVFLLQTVCKIPLGYDFNIYTYGPYSSEVMEDIDWARYQDIISIETVIYPTGHTGYNLKPSINIKKIMQEESKFIAIYQPEIEKVVSIFGNKTAKELELLTTIVYLYQNYIMNHWECNIEEVSKNVHEVKPHFHISEIRKEYTYLEDLGFLN